MILGTVTDSSLRPLADADVSIALSRVHVTADARGGFQILDMPDGAYLLTVRRLGFRPIAAGVTVRGGDTLRLAFMLEPSITELTTVNVTENSWSPRRREFEQRRRAGAGEFFDQQQIEARNVVSTFDILRQAKALRIDIEAGKLFAMSARQHTRCPMQVYVDGVPLAGRAADEPFDLQQLPSPKETMGIEVYAGPESTPLWLPNGPPSGKPGCGAILIWTRDGSTTRP